MTHTPGPFAISRSATPEYAPQFAIYAENGSQHDIAIVKGDNAESDANLFAASPDMLEALEWLRDEYCEGGALDGTEAETMILSAIAKAASS